MVQFQGETNQGLKLVLVLVTSTINTKFKKSKYHIKSSTKIQVSFQILSQKIQSFRLVKLEDPQKKSRHSTQLVNVLVFIFILVFFISARGSEIHKSRRNLRSWWTKSHVKRPKYVKLNRRKRLKKKEKKEKEAAIKST